MSTPEQIQNDVERARADLSADVNRLAEKVSPPRVVARRVDRLKSGATSLRERVMGSPESGSGLRAATHSTTSSAERAKEAISSTAGDAKDAISSTAGDAKDALASAPQTVRAQTQGTPLAAGVVAFGVGMVLSSLLPASQAEQQVAERAESTAKEHQDQLLEPVKQAGQQMAGEMKPTVQQATEQMKSSAQDAAQEVKGEAKSATQDVKTPMQRP